MGFYDQTLGSMNRTKELRVIIVIPLYNHADTVGDVAKRAITAGWPVLVVDDGSSDGGIEQVRDLGCEIIRFAVNRGKGSAILAGAEFARKRGYDAIVTVDADGQFDPAHARLLVDAARQRWPSIVVGERIMDRSTAPRSSLFGRSFSNFWVRLESGVDVSDSQSGFRLYPVRELLDLHVKSNRYDFEVEVLVRAAWAGLDIHSVPVAVYYPPEDKRVSHFHKIKDNLRLTMLHSRLVLSALNPLPKRKVDKERVKNGMDRVFLHPVKLLKRLCMEHTSPALLAAGVWTGFFLGALPLIACHTIVIIYVCHKLHLNKVAAVAASQFCCPPVVPLLCIETGYFLRNGEFLLEFSWDTAFFELHQRLWEWFIGSLVIGPFLGCIAAILVYLAVVWLRKRRCALNVN